MLDFGIAQASERVTEAGDASVLCSPGGTLWYMRPVAVHALETNTRIAPDKRDDVYALGIILYQTLAGELCHPLEIEGSLSDTYLELPDGGRFPDPFLRKSCDALIVRALGLSPGSEFPDATALHDAGKRLRLGWQHYQWEQAERRATLLAEHQLNRQEAQHKVQQRALRRQARRWLFAMAALTALIFWGGLLSFWILERKRELRVLTGVTDRAISSARASRGALSVDNMPEVLAQLRLAHAKDREVPQPLVQVFNRYLLAYYGLRSDNRAIDLFSIKKRVHWMPKGMDSVRGLTVALDANIVAVGGEDGYFGVGHRYSDGWSKEGDLPPQVRPGERYPIGPIALSSDGRWLGLAYDLGFSAFLFKTEGGPPLNSPRLPDGMRLSSLAIEDQGKRILLGTSDGAIFFWHPSQSDSMMPCFERHTLSAPIRQLASLKDGQLLAATDNRVVLLSVAEKRPLAILEMKVLYLLPHRSGALEMVVQTDKTPQLWSVNASLLRQLQSDLSEGCPLQELLANAPELHEIRQSWRSLRPSTQTTSKSFWACYRIVCQHWQMTSTDKAQTNPACEHLEAPDDMRFFEAWGPL